MWTPDEEEKLSKLVKAGHGFNDISRILGKSRGAVGNKAYRDNLPVTRVQAGRQDLPPSRLKAKHEWPVEKETELKRLISLGRTNREICKLMNITFSALTNKISRMDEQIKKDREENGGTISLPTRDWRPT